MLITIIHSLAYTFVLMVLFTKQNASSDQHSYSEVGKKVNNFFADNYCKLLVLDESKDRFTSHKDEINNETSNGAHH